METETQACDQCYRTKQVCSKTLPSCQRCLKSSGACTYSFGKFMGKPKRSTKRPGVAEKDKTTGIAKAIKDQDLLKTPSPAQAKNFYSPNQQKQWSPAPPDFCNDESDSSHDSPPSVQGSPALNPSLNTTDWAGKRATNTPACDQCYRFKVKCSREPSCCQRCANNRSVCTYSAAAEKTDRKKVLLKQHRKKRARCSSLEGVSTYSGDLGMSSTESQAYSYTASPASQADDNQADDMSYYDFGAPIPEVAYFFPGQDANDPTTNSNTNVNSNTHANTNTYTVPSSLPIPFAAESMTLQSSEQYPRVWGSFDESPILPARLLEPSPDAFDKQMPRQLLTPTETLFKIEDVNTVCNCFPTALEVLRQLNSAQYAGADCQNTGFNLNVPGNAIEACETFVRCPYGHSGIVQTIFGVILQEVSSYYTNTNDFDYAQVAHMGASVSIEMQRKWTEKQRLVGVWREMGRRNAGVGLEKDGVWGMEGR